MKNKKVVWIIIGIISVALIALAITYAYWQITASQQGVNEISSACLDISLVDAESGNTGVTLQDQFPLSDTEGAKLKPYKFTVTNNCDSAVDYHVNLEAVGDSTSALKAYSIKTALDDNDIKTLYEYVSADTTINDAYEAYLIGYGTLSSAGSDGSSVTHELRLWIDEDAPVSENNKTFKSKITAVIGQGVSSGGDYLADLIKNDAEANNYLYDTVPNFSETSNDGEYGLYKTADNYGESYYFRGDVENNYVVFGPKEKKGAYVATEVDSEVVGGSEGVALYSSMVYSSKNTCEVAGQISKAWTECEDLENVSIVYNSGTGNEEKYGLIGYLTEEYCISGNSVDSCAQKSVTRETLPEMYWRIVRINGDDSVRLIYDGSNKALNGENHLAAIGSSPFNTSVDDPKYVGYIYDNNSSSTIKTFVDNWYSKKLEERYGRYISDNVFCSDTDINYTYDSSVYFNTYNRLYTNKSPKLICSEKNSLTVQNAKLTKPIGLASADELAMAGAVFNVPNTNTYLKQTNWYWTMSPGFFVNNKANVWFYGSSGVIYYGHDVDFNGTVRPVINIKFNALFTGSGSIDDPYVLVEG